MGNDKYCFSSEELVMLDNLRDELILELFDSSFKTYVLLAYLKDAYIKGKVGFNTGDKK